MKVNFKQDALVVMNRLCDDIMCQLNGGPAKVMVGGPDEGCLAGVNGSLSEVSGYVSQRSIIYDVFDKTSGRAYTLSSIVLRLTVVDSFYSTNARYSYFSIEKLAEAIWNLGTEHDASEYFYDIARKAKNDSAGLFSAPYGIRKNLGAGNQLMSLMSKYAYYALLLDKVSYPLGFPIYDSLVMDVYPTVCENLRIDKHFGKSAMPSIDDYVAALDDVRNALFVSSMTLYRGYFPQFDILDAYLWRMGKLAKGNYSLLLNHDDYHQFVNNLGLVGKDGKDLHALYPMLKSKDKKTEFVDVVRHLCATTKSIKSIVNRLSNASLMELLITHWGEYYIK